MKVKENPAVVGLLLENEQETKAKTQESYPKGSRKNKFTDLAPGFRLDLVAPIEQNHRNSSTV